MCGPRVANSGRQSLGWARGGGEMSGDNSGLEGWLVSASWELDLWGRVRYSKRSAEEQYASTEADFRFARQSLAALVAKSWFLATEASLQQELLTAAVDAGPSCSISRSSGFGSVSATSSTLRRRE